MAFLVTCLAAGNAIMMLVGAYKRDNTMFVCAFIAAVMFAVLRISLNLE